MARLTRHTVARNVPMGTRFIEFGMGPCTHESSEDYRASSSVRLFLVIENRMLREAMTAIFRQRPDFSIIGSVRFSEMAYSQAASSQWDVLLADQASSAAFHRISSVIALQTTQGRKAILFGMDDDADAF